MIHKRVILDQIEITRMGVINLRFKKEILEDDIVLSSQYHRTVLTPDTDVEQQLKNVNVHLLSMGYPAVDSSEYENLQKYLDLTWTDTVIAEYKKQEEENLVKEIEAKGFSSLTF